MRKSIVFLVIFLFSFSCMSKNEDNISNDLAFDQDTISLANKGNEEKESKILLPEDIKIRKEFLYDKYTLEDSYPYKDTTRVFQWDKIRESLAKLENYQKKPVPWGVLQNRKNIHGEAPLVRNFIRNSFTRVTDTLGIERYQGIPLYLPQDSIAPERYGIDGELVELTGANENYYHLNTTYIPGKWIVPRKYVKALDTLVFNKAIFVDRKNQNIVTMEKTDTAWLVRSMNPATTGLHKPPYQQETPLGMFVVQEKKNKMIYLVDGTSDYGGFAPYASRFSNGGYIHGIPVNAPGSSMIEFSQTLGTTPRSHMCVRNATSHAKFIYDWAPVGEALVFVID